MSWLTSYKNYISNSPSCDFYKPAPKERDALIDLSVSDSEEEQQESETKQKKKEVRSATILELEQCERSRSQPQLELSQEESESEQVVELELESDGCKKRDRTEFEKAGISNYWQFEDVLRQHNNYSGPINYNNGSEGLAVAATEFGGDGCYPVRAQYADNGLVTSIIIDFENGEPIESRLIGSVGVDSGSILITDPSYIFPRKSRKYK